MGETSDHRDPSTTTHLNVVDRHGNMVALTQTLLSVFGSKVVLPSSGVLMNNGIMWFDPRPGSPNSLAPGKRPLTNMNPMIVRRDGKAWFAIGASGGRKILPAVFQVASFLIDHGMSLEDAFHQPRIDASGGDTVSVDPRLPDAMRKALAAAVSDGRDRARRLSDELRVPQRGAARPERGHALRRERRHVAVVGRGRRGRRARRMKDEWRKDEVSQSGEPCPDRRQSALICALQRCCPADPCLCRGDSRARRQCPIPRSRSALIVATPMRTPIDSRGAHRRPGARGSLGSAGHRRQPRRGRRASTGGRSGRRRPARRPHAAGRTSTYVRHAAAAPQARLTTPSAISCRSRASPRSASRWSCIRRSPPAR